LVWTSKCPMKPPVLPKNHHSMGWFSFAIFEDFKNPPSFIPSASTRYNHWLPLIRPVQQHAHHWRPSAHMTSTAKVSAK
jgi:hypothetical protein